MDPHAYIDALIQRATTLLAFMTPEEAAETLIESGVAGGEAYLAVQAGKLALTTPVTTSDSP